jgi:SAM-dependent methyltransferase
LPENLVCPRDRAPLGVSDDELVCGEGHSYRRVGGIPVLLAEEVSPTHPAFAESLARAEEGDSAGSRPVEARGGVDPFVQGILVDTCGQMYRPLLHKLARYPIPELRLPASAGGRLLDIGCGWGRWCVAAARKGFAPIGLDPSLESVEAAVRVADQLEVDAQFVVGDGRHLPFAAETFDAVFSYSVLQHFGEEDVRLVLDEVRRVLKPNGTAVVEMPNKYGLRNLYQQARRRFRVPVGFEVRYWRPSQLRAAFENAIGPAAITVDAYFFINGQPADRDLLPARYRAALSVSEALRRASRRAPALVHAADSLYVTAWKR